jgi:two-component system phosphate regulon response regulator OmpR
MFVVMRASVVDRVSFNAGMVAPVDAPEVSFGVSHVIADTQAFGVAARPTSAATFAATRAIDATPLPAAATTTVLLIDDDAELAGLLGQLFAREGMLLRHASRGAEGISLATEGGAAPDLVLLDLMLPDVGGIDVFRALRDGAARLPVIMLTARGDPVDRVVGLELGADDYVAKPFDPRELVARVRAVLRRAAVGEPSADPGGTRRIFGTAVLDLAARTFSVGEREVPLTAIEFRLLVELATHPGQTRSREALTRAGQVGNYRPLERAVDVQIARLRRKLRAVDASAPWIATERGGGYRWTPPDVG